MFSISHVLNIVFLYLTHIYLIKDPVHATHTHIHTQSQSLYIKIMVFWVLTPCTFVRAYKWFKKICYLSLQDRLLRWNKLPHISSTNLCTWCHNTKIHELNLQHRENPRSILLHILLDSLKLSFTVHWFYCP